MRDFSSRKARFRRLLVLLAGFAASLPFPAFAASFKVIPNSVDLDAQQKRAMITVTNSGEEKLTLQLRVMRWSQNEQGKDVYEPTRDLVFYPQILTIDAGKERIVRVGYEGAETPTTERTYRLFLQELPVAGPGENVLKIALRVAIPVFLAPGKPQSKATLEGLRIEEGKLQVSVKNGGNNHVLVKQIKIIGLDEAGGEVFSKETSGWYILAGIRKDFPIEIFREDCQQATVLKALVTAVNLTLEGQLALDEAGRARLAGRDDQKKEAEDRQPLAPSED